MRILSVNTSEPVSIQWKGREVVTGIYKKPVDGPIVLQSTYVENDTVVETKYHGGIDKACYLFSADYYDYWKERYPKLDWTFGMFGENITVEGMDEKEIRIGDIYAVGDALLQVSQPRQPCYKLGVKFGTQKILKEFIQFGHPGVYARVIQPGKVWSGDTLHLQISPDSLSITEVFSLLYQKNTDKKMLERALVDTNLASSAKSELSRFHQIKA